MSSFIYISAQVGKERHFISLQKIHPADTHDLIQGASKLFWKEFQSACTGIQKQNLQKRNIQRNLGY